MRDKIKCLEFADALCTEFQRVKPPEDATLAFVLPFDALEEISIRWFGRKCTQAEMQELMVNLVPFMDEIEKPCTAFEVAHVAFHVMGFDETRH